MWYTLFYKNSFPYIIFFHSSQKSDNQAIPGLNSQDVSQVKRAYAKQRARDFADHASKLVIKEQEIQALKKELTRQQSGDSSQRVGVVLRQKYSFLLAVEPECNSANLPKGHMCYVKMFAMCLQRWHGL